MDIYIKTCVKMKKMYTYIYKHSNNSIITKNSRTHTQISATLAGVKSGVDSLTLSETLIQQQLHQLLLRGGLGKRGWMLHIQRYTDN